ncbi:MAG: CheR family methyltransferase, partial [Balneolaceae bacterium]
FRDPKNFEALEKNVIPKLFGNKQSDDELRVWVPGCATGEEAYSIAMLLHEHAGRVDDPPEIKIFATDVDDDALHSARKGRYAESIVTDLTEERLHRYFNKTGHG